MRKIIAERMVKSKQTAAQVTHVDEADMTELVLLSEAFKGSAEKRGVRLTYLPFVDQGARARPEGVPVRELVARRAGRKHRPEEVLQHRNRHGHRTGPGGPGREGRRHEGRLRAGGRDREARREGEERAARPRRGPRLHLHDHQRRRDWRALRHADNQPPRGRDPRPPQDYQATRRQGRQDRGQRHRPTSR